MLQLARGACSSIAPPDTRRLFTTVTMSFFRRKDKSLIPPVESERTTNGTPTNSSSPRPAYRPSNANSYVPSRDGQDPYSNSNQQPKIYTPPDPHYFENYENRDKYSRSNGVGDVYSRGQANLEQDRNELFSGYKPNKAGSGRFFDGPSGNPNEPPPGEENEEDVEGIKQQTRYVKQESVNSTRNALRMAREAEETARNTLGRLGDQSGMLSATHRALTWLTSNIKKNWPTPNAIWMSPRAIRSAQTTRPTNSRS